MSMNLRRIGRPSVEPLPEVVKKRAFHPSISNHSKQDDLPNFHAAAQLLNFTQEQLNEAFGWQPVDSQGTKQHHQCPNPTKKRNRGEKSQAKREATIQIQNRFDPPPNYRNSPSKTPSVWNPERAYLDPVPGGKLDKRKKRRKKEHNPDDVNSSQSATEQLIVENENCTKIVFEREAPSKDGLNFESILEKQALESILVREGCLRKLQEQFRLFETRKRCTIVDNTILHTIHQIRLTTVDVTEAIQKWQALYVQPREFIYFEVNQEPVNYLLKIVSSLDFLQNTEPFREWAKDRSGEPNDFVSTISFRHQLTANPLLLPHELYERVKYLPSAAHCDITAVPKVDAGERIATPSVLANTETNDTSETVWSRQAVSLSAEGFVNEVGATRVKECIRKLCEEEYVFGKIEDTLKLCRWCSRIPPNRKHGGQAFATCMECKLKVCEACVQVNRVEGSESFDTIRRSTKWRCYPCHDVLQLQQQAKELKKERMRLANEKRKADLKAWKEKKRIEEAEAAKQKEEDEKERKKRPSGAARIAAQQLRRKRIQTKKARNAAKHFLRKLARRIWIQRECQQQALVYLTQLGARAQQVEKRKEKAVEYLQTFAQEASKQAKQEFTLHRDRASSIDLFEIDAFEARDLFKKIPASSSTKTEPKQKPCFVVTRTADGRKVIAKFAVESQGSQEHLRNLQISLFDAVTGYVRTIRLEHTRMIEWLEGTSEVMSTELTNALSSHLANPCTTTKETAPHRTVEETFERSLNCVIGSHYNWHYGALLRQADKVAQVRPTSVSNGTVEPLLKKSVHTIQQRWTHRMGLKCEVWDGHLKSHTRLHAQMSIVSQKYMRVSAFWYPKQQTSFSRCSIRVPLSSEYCGNELSSVASSLTPDGVKTVKNLLKEYIFLSNKVNSQQPQNTLELTWQIPLVSLFHLAIPIVRRSDQWNQIVGEVQVDNVFVSKVFQAQVIDDQCPYELHVRVISKQQSNQNETYYDSCTIPVAQLKHEAELQQHITLYLQNHLWYTRSNTSSQLILKIDDTISNGLYRSEARSMAANITTTIVADSCNKYGELERQRRLDAHVRCQRQARVYLIGRVRQYRAHLLRQKKARDALTKIAIRARDTILARVQARVELVAYAEFARKVAMGDEEAVKRHQDELRRMEVKKIEESLNTVAHKDRLLAVHQQGTTMMVTEV